MTQEHLQKAPSPWSSNEALSAEIKAKMEHIDYAKMLGANRVLMLGENHRNSPIRYHLAGHAADFKAAGITHYAIEAPHHPVFDQLPQADTTGVPVGPFRMDPGYAHAAKAMARNGISVVGIDMDQTVDHTEEEREAHITKGVTDILEQNPDAKVAVLIGGFHATRKTDRYTEKLSAAHRLTDQGVGVTIAQYIGGTEPVPTMFLGAAQEAGQSSREFMMDLRPYADDQSGNVVFGAGQADYAIHLPQEAGFSSLSSLGTLSMSYGLPRI